MKPDLKDPKIMSTKARCVKEEKQRNRKDLIATPERVLEWIAM